MAPRRALELLHLERRAQDRRQVADVLGDEEVVLHEALDGPEPALLLVAELLGEERLQIEGQPFLGAPRQEVQEAAHRPEEVLALAEGPCFLAREDAGRDRRRADLVIEEVFREPVQRVQVAQARPCRP